MTLNDRIRRNVRLVAAYRGVSQQGIADGLGLSANTIRSRYAGHYPWPTQQLDRLAELLDVEVAALVTETLIFDDHGPRAPQTATTSRKSPEVAA